MALCDSKSVIQGWYNIYFWWWNISLVCRKVHCQPFFLATGLKQHKFLSNTTYWLSLNQSILIWSLQRADNGALVQWSFCDAFNYTTDGHVTTGKKARGLPWVSHFRASCYSICLEMTNPLRPPHFLGLGALWSLPAGWKETTANIPHQERPEHFSDACCPPELLSQYSPLILWHLVNHIYSICIYLGF